MVNALNYPKIARIVISIFWPSIAWTKTTRFLLQHLDTTEDKFFFFIVFNNVRFYLDSSLL